MNKESLSYLELKRIKHLRAFNINCISSRRVNQYCTDYNFTDGSNLIVNHYAQNGTAINSTGWAILVCLLKINKRGEK